MPGQCPDPVASYGIVGNLTTICEGEAIHVDNKADEANPVSCIDYMVWDWGDGKRDTITDYNNKSHVYSFPPFDGSCSLGTGKNYDIELTVVYKNKDFHYQISPVKVRPKPQAVFSAPNPICIDKPMITLSNHSCYAETYKWTIQPGNITFTTESPQYTFPAIGKYTVTLEAFSPAAWGCGSSTTTQTIEVLPAPEGVAVANITDFCAPSLLKLSANGTKNYTAVKWSISVAGGGSYTWIGGDSVTHTLNAWASLNAPGEYTVKLEVWGAQDCTKDEVILDKIIIKSSPVAAWSGMPISGCLENGTFTFDPNSNVSNNGGYSNLTYQWFFQNGNPANFTGQNPPAVNYSATGQHLVTLVVTGDPDPANPCGRDTLKQNINITNESVVSVTPTGIPADGCGPFTVNFSNQSSGGAGWIWTVKKANGQPAVAPTDYEFVQNTTEKDQNPIIIFKTAFDFIVKMEMLNVACGSAKSWELPVKVKTAPKIMQLDPTPICVPATFQPKLSVQENGNDPAATFNWTFENGDPDEFPGIAPPGILYKTAGKSQIICTAQNSCATVSDTVVLELIQKQQVAIEVPHPDSLCKNGMPIQLKTNLTSAVFPPSLPNGLFDPANFPGGLHQIIVNNGSTDPGCATFDTTQIFVLDVDLKIGTLENFCDTIGTAQVLGFSPANNSVFSGGNYVSASGLANAQIAGFGNHKIYLTHTEAVLGCIFKDSLEFQVFELPESGIQTATDIGCTQIPVDFNYPHDPTGLSFSWDFGDGSAAATGSAVSHIFQNAGNYTVTLTARNGNDCTKTAQKDIKIEAPLQISLTLDPVEACAETDILLTCPVVGQNPNWLVFLGNFDTLVNFSNGVVQFPSGVEDTIFTVRAAGNNACPEVSEAVEILIHPLPDAILGVSSLTICSGDTVTFSQKSTGLPLTTAHFDSGQGYSGGMVPASKGFVYFAKNDLPTVYLAILSVENQCDAAADTVEILVLPESIQPFFQLNDTLLCVGDTLNIQSFATDPLHQNALQVTYQLENGTTLTSANALLVFDKPGRIGITQWVTDGCAWDSLKRWVTIRPAPEVGLTVAPDTICQNGTAILSFPDSLDAQFLSFEWKINGQPAAGGGKKLEYLWPNPGWQNVQLTVLHDTTGCRADISKNVHVRANPVPQIAASDSIDCGKLAVILTATNQQPDLFQTWFLSDGTTDVGNSIQHVFDSAGLFSVKLRTADVFGCFGEVEKGGFLVNPLPNPKFKTSGQFHCGTPAEVILKNETQDALGARWFLDGQLISTQTDTILNFEQAGNYKFTLRSVNQFGCEDEASHDFRVYPNLKAKAAVDSVFCQSEILPAQNLSENADGWRWDFGNGATSTLENPNYKYPQAGQYFLTLIAKQDSSCADTFHLKVELEVKISPVAGFSVRDTSKIGINDGSVICQDSSVGATDWLYEFADINFTSTEQNPQVQYTSNSFHTILQTVFNDLGCWDSTSVNFKPADFGGLVVPNAIMPNSRTRGLHTVFQPVGVGLDSYLIEVFSPGGDRVWWSDVLVNGSPTEFWDGRDAAGKELPAGAYLWKVEARLQSLSNQKPRWEGMPVSIGSDKKSTYGTVTLIR